MTDSNVKRAIREYMAEHGVNYTSAKRALEAGDSPAVPTATTSGSGVPAAFPFAAITVACGTDRDAAFEAATKHFIDCTGFMDESGPGWEESRFRRVDVDGRSHKEWWGRVRSLMFCDLLDEVAVARVDEAPESAAVAQTLVELSMTGHAVVVSLDVPDLDSAHDFFRTALVAQGLDPAEAAAWVQGRCLLLDDALLASNEEQQQARAQKIEAQGNEKRRALLNAKEDIAGVKRRLGAYDPDYPQVLDRLVLPFARMRPGKGLPAPTGSFVGGYPYVPAGTPADQVWPQDGDGPMVFLCQVNFAEVATALKAPLPGFPTSGLLQWFVGADGTYGQTFDEPTTGFDGLHVRWYPAADLSAPALHSPDTEPPVDAHEAGPLNTAAPVRVTFRPAKGLPGHIEVDDRHTAAGAQVGAMLDAIEAAWDAAEARGEDLGDEADPDGLYDGCDLDDPNGFGAGDRVGGYPALVQTDPRAEHPDRAGTLLVQLDSDGGFFTMWGDGGSGQLFGDPAALATGDTSSLWWSWSCH